MVKKNQNFKRGKIYLIRCRKTGKRYYGSTCEKLELREYNHGAHFKSFLGGKANYLTAFEVLKNNDYEIILIELFPCDTIEELRRREGEIIKQKKEEGYLVVNKNIAGRTKHEYYVDNQTAIKDRAYTQEQCECGTMSTYNHIARHKKTKLHIRRLNELNSDLD